MSSTIEAAALAVGARAVYTDRLSVIVVEVVAQRSNPASTDVRLRVLAVVSGRPPIMPGGEIDRSCGRGLQWGAGWWLRDIARYADTHPLAREALAAWRA